MVLLLAVVSSQQEDHKQIAESFSAVCPYPQRAKVHPHQDNMWDLKFIDASQHGLLYLLSTKKTKKKKTAEY